MIDAGHCETAATVSLRAASVWPHHWPIHLQLGRALAEAGRLDEAIDTYRACARQLPDLPGPPAELARLLLHRHDFEGAEAALELARERHLPEQRRLRIAAGIARGRGDSPSLIDALERLADLEDPPTAATLVQLAYARLAGADRAGAVAAADRALALDPCNPGATRFKVVTVESDGDLDAALRLVEAGLTRDAGNPEFVPHLHFLRGWGKRSSEISTLLRRAAERWPDHPTVRRFALGYGLVQPRAESLVPTGSEPGPRPTCVSSSRRSSNWRRWAASPMP